MTSKANLLLLREPTLSSGSGKDRYGSAFVAAKCAFLHFRTRDVTHYYSNLSELASVKEQSKFDGVTMTNARSYEAWDKPEAHASGVVFTNPIACSYSHRQDFHSMLSGCLLPVLRRYVPGRPTPTSVENIQGAACQFHSRRTTSSYETTVSVTGDKNRNTLPNILGCAGVSLHSLKAY
ncbi:hypothetical protein IW261DRAFT_1606294 [Armillaria novae-zelandiae]|uniref:Uncharacterized protein n=1 Tax=Armillaria novae-zelandiae TaxID=153914 RepID=A0AA39PFJ8_9AGAR|nr:hypothetical protein IW261DRAFT_1606294 [Armillaria novae-zelandiae]